MSKPYKECPHCGAHLDPGEFCTCRDKQRSEGGHAAGEYADQPTLANPHQPVLNPGA